MQSKSTPGFIRLTNVSQRDKPKEMMVNTSHIRRAEAVRSKDRIFLLLYLMGESEPVMVGAINEWGKNTVLEKSEDEVLATFRTFLLDRDRQKDQDRPSPRW